MYPGIIQTPGDGEQHRTDKQADHAEGDQAANDAGEDKDHRQVGTMDNVIRPVLIRMGADLPMILILTGVIGGLIAFGMIGLFIGPVLLAVSWRLYDAWVHEVPPPPKDPDVVLEELSELEAGRK